jgi:hypothetical protein
MKDVLMVVFGLGAWAGATILLLGLVIAGPGFCIECMDLVDEEKARADFMSYKPEAEIISATRDGEDCSYLWWTINYKKPGSGEAKKAVITYSRSHDDWKARYKEY